VIDVLRPFIVTSWHGHRGDKGIPAAVREVWSAKFRGPGPGRDRRPPRGGPDRQQQSNVDIAVLDANGEVVHSFDGFKRPRPGRRFGRGESLAEYTAAEIREGARRLGRLPARPKTLEPRLEDLGKRRGVRVFVRLMDDRMKAYQAPVVELVPLSGDDARLLSYPSSKRRLSATRLHGWLSQVYPPGVMERTDPRTKKAYGVKKVDGELTLTPAGSKGEERFAILKGTVRFTDEGPDDFTYEGELSVVLSYSGSGSTTPDLRGVFTGVYPRRDPRRKAPRRLPLHAVFESVPR